MNVKYCESLEGPKEYFLKSQNYFYKQIGIYFKIRFLPKFLKTYGIGENPPGNACEPRYSTVFIHQQQHLHVPRTRPLFYFSPSVVVLRGLWCCWPFHKFMFLVGHTLYSPFTIPQLKRMQVSSLDHGCNSPLFIFMQLSHHLPTFFFFVCQHCNR